MIRVVVNGAAGRMGRLVCAAIEATSDLTLVGRCGRSDDLGRTIADARADVVVDFTLPDVVRRSALAIVDAGARPVIGTSGVEAALREELAARCAARRIGAIIAPNFAIGALLMMRFAEMAARHLDAVEIVEAHHAGKRDAPSGTAAATAERISLARSGPTETAGDGGARGERHHGIPIHSIRLPGVVAEQSVLFGAAGQKLVIEHVTYGREAYLPGVLLACRAVMRLDRLVVGLDTVLFDQEMFDPRSSKAT